MLSILPFCPPSDLVSKSARYERACLLLLLLCYTVRPKKSRVVLKLGGVVGGMIHHSMIMWYRIHMGRYVLVLYGLVLYGTESCVVVLWVVCYCKYVLGEYCMVNGTFGAILCDIVWYCLDRRVVWCEIQ